MPRPLGSSLAHLRRSGAVLTNSAGVPRRAMADWVIARSLFHGGLTAWSRAAQGLAKRISPTRDPCANSGAAARIFGWRDRDAGAGVGWRSYVGRAGGARPERGGPRRKKDRPLEDLRGWPPEVMCW